MRRTTARFWTCFARLPEAAQKVARQNFHLLKVNPAHGSLRFKKVGNLWSARVGLSHRALGVEDGGPAPKDEDVWDLLIRMRQIVEHVCGPTGG